MSQRNKQLKYYDRDARLATFKNWPYDKDGICTSDRLADAGFFRPNPRKRPDEAVCYVCLKSLEGWEESDDPWVEHKDHKPHCPLVKLYDKGVDITNLTVDQTIRLELEIMKIDLHNSVESIRNEFLRRVPLVEKQLQNLKP